MMEKQKNCNLPSNPPHERTPSAQEHNEASSLVPIKVALEISELFSIRLDCSGWEQKYSNSANYTFNEARYHFFLETVWKHTSSPSLNTPRSSKSIIRRLRIFFISSIFCSTASAVLIKCSRTHNIKNIWNRRQSVAIFYSGKWKVKLTFKKLNNQTNILLSMMVKLNKCMSVFPWIHIKNASPMGVSHHKYRVKDIGQQIQTHVGKKFTLFPVNHLFS